MTTRRSLLGAGVLGLAAALGACTSRAPSPSSPTPASSPDASPSPTPSPTPTAVDPLPAGIVNALVFGTDSREKTSLTGNADAIVVAQISADRKALTLVSIARDSYVSYASGSKKGKINGSFASGSTEGLRTTVSNLLGGLPIHMVAQANFNGFIAVTRWLGGITVKNRHATKVTVNSTGRLVEFPEGELTLENTDGLIYARERKTMPLGDLDRAERHRALVVGMLRGLQAVAVQRPAEFATLAGHVIGNVKVTDFDAARVADLAVPLQQIDLDQVTSLMVPIARFDTINGAAVDIVHESRTAELAAQLKAGDVSAYVAQYGTDYAPRA